MRQKLYVRNRLLLAAFAVLVSIAALLGAERRPVPLGLDAYMPTPADNPLTPEKIVLGRRLFFDKQLSRDATLSCATCHDPELGFTDDNPVSVGVGGQRGSRRTPRLINRGYGQSFFWDGRATTLEDQVLQPIENPIEMDLPITEAVRRLRGDETYGALFDDAFGLPPSSETTAMALASYVRTIVSGDSPYDLYVAGDESALSERQRRGLGVFRGKGACTVCHLGPNLSDEEFHNTGVGWSNGEVQDEGRYLVTADSADLGAFKTPSLRDVALSGPYMHDGSLATLKEVVEFYDKGGEPNSRLDEDIQRLDLTEPEKDDLVSFLEALNGKIREGL